jgi:hypothetical protein
MIRQTSLNIATKERNKKLSVKKTMRAADSAEAAPEPCLQLRGNFHFSRAKCPERVRRERKRQRAGYGSIRLYNMSKKAVAGKTKKKYGICTASVFENSSKFCL